MYTISICVYMTYNDICMYILIHAEHIDINIIISTLLRIST